MKRGIFLSVVVLFVLICALVFVIKPQTVKEGDPTPIETTEEDNDAVHTLDQTYTNTRFGFQLTFPENWVGNYSINEDEEGCIEVCFVGKSEVSRSGLTMFCIGSEDYVSDMEYIDGLRRIGKVNGTNYYYFTNMDSPISLLNVDSVFVADHGIDREEQELMVEDYLKALAMQKNIEEIHRTFGPIE